MRMNIIWLLCISAIGVLMSIAVFQSAEFLPITDIILGIGGLLVYWTYVAITAYETYVAYKEPHTWRL